LGRGICWSKFDDEYRTGFLTVPASGQTYELHFDAHVIFSDRIAKLAQADGNAAAASKQSEFA